MSKTFYAHSGKDPAKSDWQRLDDHLTRVARIAGENVRVFRDQFKTLGEVVVLGLNSTFTTAA